MNEEKNPRCLIRANWGQRQRCSPYAQAPSQPTQSLDLVPVVMDRSCWMHVWFVVVQSLFTLRSAPKTYGEGSKAIPDGSEATYERQKQPTSPISALTSISFQHVL